MIMADDYQHLLNDLKAIPFTFKSRSFPLPGAPEENLDRSQEKILPRLAQITAKFPDLPDAYAIFLANNFVIFQKIMQSSLSTAQLIKLVDDIALVQTHSTFSLVFEEFPQLQERLASYKSSFFSLLASQIFWRSIFLVVTLLALFFFYEVSQNGRYHRLEGNLILDTRTGTAYLPYGAYGEKKLIPVFDPRLFPRPSYPDKDLSDIIDK